MASIRRKSAAVALAVVGVAGLTLASAAQLNVNSSSLGAGQTVVASCQAPADGAITVGFANAYNATSKDYDTTAVTLANVAGNCTGRAISITVADGSGTALASFTGTVGAAPYDLTADVPAKSIQNVSVVISG